MGIRNEDRARALFDSEQLGHIPPHELPDFATELLVLGYDSPSLRELAGLPRQDRSEALELWDHARHELGIRRGTREEAAEFLLEYWAREVLEGRVEVLEGGMLMHRAGWFPLGQPTRLNGLTSLLDDWDELPSRRETILSQLLTVIRDISNEKQ